MDDARRERALLLATALLPLIVVAQVAAQATSIALQLSNKALFPLCSYEMFSSPRTPGFHTVSRGDSLNIWFSHDGVRHSSDELLPVYVPLRGAIAAMLLRSDPEGTGLRQRACELLHRSHAELFPLDVMIDEDSFELRGGAVTRTARPPRHVFTCQTPD